jgi:anti-sigma-K factor RskA
MPCSGLVPDIYDRYVLGLLEGKELAELEKHLTDDCPTCLRNVRRSIDLWLVFASTLEDVEPSADFRSRIMRIAELSKKILTFPKPPVISEQPRIGLRWWWFAVTGAVVVILIAGAWVAGHQSSSIQVRQLSAQLDRVAQEMSQSTLILNQETAKRREAEKQIRDSHNSTAVGKQNEELLRRNLQLEAEVNQYKAVMERQRTSQDDSVRILKVLALPGLRLIPMKGSDTGATSTGYALIQETSRVVLVASNLPKLADAKQFQLWVFRKQEPKTVSAGVFNADSENRALVEFQDPEVLSEITSIAVTDEPIGGSNSGPTGAKLLVGSAIEEE